MIVFYISHTYLKVNTTICISDLETEKSFKFRTPLNNDLDGSNSIVQRASVKDGFISVLTASEMIKSAKAGKIKNTEILEFAEKLKTENNPVLRFLTFKPIQ